MRCDAMRTPILASGVDPAVTTLLLDREFTDEALRAASTADLRNVGTAAWPRVIAHCKAPEVGLYHITLQSLDGIQRLTATEMLTLEWANKITNLTPVYQMAQLTSLALIDLPKLPNIEGIEVLSALTELFLSGNRGSLTPPLRLASLEPVTRLPLLSSFTLGNAKLGDDDISVLSRCKNLRSLDLSNKFERGQFACLAKHLNPQLADPITGYVSTKLSCEKSGGKKAMFRGRRMPFLCADCDGEKFRKLEDEFAALVERS
jgi:hypothetical protein